MVMWLNYVLLLWNTGGQEIVDVVEF